MIRIRRTLTIGLGAAIAIGAPAAAIAQADWDKVVEAARKEGKVVLYTANVGVKFHHDIAAAFQKRYGIPVEILEARASEIRERIRTEQAAGRPIGDVSHNGATTTALQQRDGAFEPHGPLPALSQLKSGFQSDGTRIPLFSIVYGMLVNTRLVPPGSEPRSWKDLLDPKWKGRILADDMRALGGGSVLFFVTHDRFGRDYHAKLAEQNLTFTRDIREAERRVARGEAAIWVPFTFANYPQIRGLPVKPIVPSEGATYINYEIAVLKGSTRPNAARLLMNFFLEREAQSIYANGGYVPVAQGVALSAPPEIRELIEVKLLGTTDADRQNDMLKAAQELYK
jgi:iron(III) transport system substrate-binding protein